MAAGRNRPIVNLLMQDSQQLESSYRAWQTRRPQLFQHRSTTVPMVPSLPSPFPVPARVELSLELADVAETRLQPKKHASSSLPTARSIPSSWPIHCTVEWPQKASSPKPRPWPVRDRVGLFSQPPLRITQENLSYRLRPSPCDGTMMTEHRRFQRHSTLSNARQQNTHGMRSFVAPWSLHPRPSFHKLTHSARRPRGVIPSETAREKKGGWTTKRSMRGRGRNKRGKSEMHMRPSMQDRSTADPPVAFPPSR
jgi:hypothetical protein